MKKSKGFKEAVAQIENLIMNSIDPRIETLDYASFGEDVVKWLEEQHEAK